MGVLINEIKALPKGTKISGTFAIFTISRDISRPGNHFLRIELSDKSGKITLRVWGTRDEASISLYDPLDKNDVIEIDNATVDSYQDIPQLNLDSKPVRIRKLAEGEYDLADLIPDTKRPKDEMFEYITLRKDEIDDPHLRELMDNIFSDEELMHQFKTSPSALMIHHAHASGLLEHTWEVLNYCERLCEVHSNLDKDLVYAGAILHDIGKVKSLVASVTIDTSPEGMLLEHQYLGCEIVSKYVSEILGFPDDLNNKLRHIILSHHGDPSMGAVVRPAIPEAAAIHSADMMGSYVIQYLNAVESYVGSDFKTTRRVFPLDTKIYVE